MENQRNHTVIETKMSINHLKNNKSPGSDGLPIELLKAYVYKAVKHLQLSVTARIGEALRFLNTISKILAHIILGRLIFAIDTYLRNEQTGFSSERYRL